MKTLHLTAVLMAITTFLLPTLTIADISAFERHELAWDGYKAYIHRFPLLACEEYNYNNGPLTQDLRIYGIPSDAIVLPNSYGEIYMNQLLIQKEAGPDITRNSYTPDSITFDLPRSGTSGEQCYGVFYIVFSKPAPLTTTTSPLSDNITANITTTSSTINAITTTSLSTTTSSPSWLNDIINAIMNFIRSIFGGNTSV